MKTKVILIALVIFLSSCELTVIEPVYDDRDRVIGSYQVEEYSQTYNEYGQFRIYIRKASGYSSEVILENFYNTDLYVRAQVVDGKVYISRQLVDGYEVEGVGTIYHDKIRFTYRVRDTYYNKPTDYCEATAWIY